MSAGTYRVTLRADVQAPDAVAAREWGNEVASGLVAENAARAVTVYDVARLKPAAELSAGDRITYREHEVTILRAREPHIDLFGRELHQFWARDDADGREGYIVYGDVDVELLNDAEVEATEENGENA